jgi:hypothetical protein
MFLMFVEEMTGAKSSLQSATRSDRHLSKDAFLDQRGSANLPRRKGNYLKLFLQHIDRVFQPACSFDIICEIISTENSSVLTSIRLR